MTLRPALLCLVTLALALPHARPAATEPLFDWSPWEQHRTQVAHPGVVFKPADIARARENLQRYEWARAYLASLERGARGQSAQLTPEYLARMIPETTPGDPKFTPCPACRDLGKPVHPHGFWSWKPSDPDKIECEVCHTTFPHEKYAETVVLHAQWGKPQTLSYYGGEPMAIFAYREGRPSFSGNIRARKVGYMSGLCRTLAEAYLLTGKLEYARGARAILLRLAACYPGWLVHTGYGEYADMDPRIAAQFINQLPAPELCPPPNKPDRRLHTGYWSAGRASGVGQESGFVRRVTEAYDFTCTARLEDGTPLYGDAERRTIERDLLLESTLLLVADKQINNKSVGNRTAAALVGLCVGHPGLVRFGWEGFQRTVSEWFLPDGTTSESPAYGMMTISNIWDLPQALRGYSDPAGYRDAEGARIDRLDPYRSPHYERIWEGFFKGLQGDLIYPAYADSYRTTTLGAQYVDLMVANYPGRSEYLSLLKELSGPDLAKAHAPVALYYREPGLEARAAPPFVLPDWCPPELRIGHMRTGADGRESLLLLSASHWGVHHHQDSLNLTYWKKGAEVLSDLGYLWDHPKKSQTVRTLAHNTVLVDEREQATRERGGEVRFFQASPHVKVMEAESRAYPEAALYRRTSAIVDHGGGRNYVVDFFRVQGGRRQDFVFHASAATCEVADLGLAPAGGEKVYDLSALRAGDGAGVWRATWAGSKNITCVAWSVGQPGERVYVGAGWGQRDWKNSDIGATLPYLVRRTEGSEARTFVSVFEGYEGAQAFVRRVTRIAPGVVAVETALGTDYIVSQLEAGPVDLATAAGRQTVKGRFAVVAVAGGRVAWTFTQ